MTGPLDGVRVVELGVWVAGPAAGGILADWGADVVKIEPPGIGDPGRLFGAMLGGDLPFNPPFELDNRGKRSIVIDLATDEGRAVALELVDGADVFLTNVRLGGLERIGFDGPSLTAPLTGFGLDGPDRDRAAYDIGAFWARSGIAHLLTAPGGIPPFQRGGMGDHGAGMAAAAGICAALVSRATTGKGQVVSTSLLRHGAYTIGFDINTVLRIGVPIGVATRRQMGNPAINSYQDRDGRWFWLIGLEGDRHWPNLARAAGHPEWIEDERFATALGRRKNCGELIDLLDAIFATGTREEWGRRLDEHDVWWAPVQTPDELIADEQFIAGGGLVDVPDGDGIATMVATPVDFAGTPWAVAGMSPDLGQHTDAIAAIAALRASGAVV